MDLHVLSTQKLMELYGVVTDKGLTREQLIAGIEEDRRRCASYNDLTDSQLRQLAGKYLLHIGELGREETIKRLCEIATRREVRLTQIVKETEEIVWSWSGPQMDLPNFVGTQSLGFQAALAKVRNHDRVEEDVILLTGNINHFRWFLEARGGFFKYPNVCEVPLNEPMNKELIERLLGAAGQVFNKYLNTKVILDNPDKQGGGVIGWEIQFDEPQWLLEAVPGNWDPMMNPHRNGRFVTFATCSTYQRMADCILRKLVNVNVNGVMKFNRIHPVSLVNVFPITDQKALSEYCDELLAASGEIVLCGWESHAKIIRKESDTVWYLYDTYQQQTFEPDDAVIQELHKRGVHLHFVIRDPEQNVSGPCMLIAIARAAAMSSGIAENDQIPDSIFVLVDRLSKVCRRRVL